MAQLTRLTSAKAAFAKSSKTLADRIALTKELDNFKKIILSNQKKMVKKANLSKLIEAHRKNEGLK